MKDTDTREKLMTAALGLFTEKGFAGASTREIVKRAGVTKPTLYYYFPSKEDLYQVLIEDDFGRFNGALAGIAGRPGTAPERLVGVATYCLEHCRKRPQEVKLTLMALYRGDTFAPEVDIVTPAMASIGIIAGVIREGMDSGEFRAGDPMILGTFILSVLHGQMMAILKGSGQIKLARPEEIIELFLNGISKK